MSGDHQYYHGVDHKRTQDEMGGEEANSKKNRQDPVTPSRVLHVRGLPSDAADHELIAVACPFGRVTNVMILKGTTNGPIQKTQAFVEMADVASATALIHYYAGVQASIRGKNCYFNYSNRSELSAPAAGSQQSSGADGQPGPILHVVVQNLVYPLTMDVLNQLFSKYGQLLKIVTFTKNNTFQALIKYDNTTSAAAARAALDNQNVYYGCDTLKIQYSTLTDISVKYNNDKSRDFTNPTLPSGAPPVSPMGMPVVGGQQFGAPGGFQYGGGGGGGIAYDPMGASTMAAMGAAAAAAAAAGGAGGAGSSPVLIVSGFDEAKTSVDQLFVLFGVYGDVQRIKQLYNKRGTALVQFTTAGQAQTALQHLNQCPVPNGVLSINLSKHQSISMPRNDAAAAAAAAATDSANLTKDYSNSPLHRFRNPNSKVVAHICPPSPVLHLSQIPPGTTEEALRELFSQAGRVTAVRFFAKDPRMALVEMAELQQAVGALMSLHHAAVGGGNIRVSFSKTQHVAQHM